MPNETPQQTLESLIAEAAEAKITAEDKAAQDRLLAESIADLRTRLDERAAVVNAYGKLASGVQDDWKDAKAVRDAKTTTLEQILDDTVEVAIRKEIEEYDAATKTLSDKIRMQEGWTAHADAVRDHVKAQSAYEAVKSYHAGIAPRLERVNDLKDEIDSFYDADDNKAAYFILQDLTNAIDEAPGPWTVEKLEGELNRVWFELAAAKAKVRTLAAEIPGRQRELERLKAELADRLENRKDNILEAVRELSGPACSPAPDGPQGEGDGDVDDDTE